MQARPWSFLLKLVAASSCLMAFHLVAECTPSNDSTIWGGNENVVMQISGPMRRVHGTVLEDFRSGKSTQGVLVEVYNHPDVVLRDASRSRTGQTRIIGCVTDNRGRFSFKLKSGDYELRASKGPDWNVTSVVVHVRKGGMFSKRRLVIQLFPGT